MIELVDVLADDAAAYQPFRKQAFSKLKTFQHSDGGLQWFPGMESSTMVTLYFLEKAGQLRSVGAFTPEEDELKLIRRALDYIDGRIALQGTYKEFRPFTLIRDFAVRSLWFDIPMREDAAADKRLVRLTRHDTKAGRRSRSSRNPS